MTQHAPQVRRFPMTYAQDHPFVTVSDTFRGHPCSGGALVMFPMPAGLNGQPYLGMDPSAPATYVRPWNPQPGMIARLNFDGAQHQGHAQMGGTWRNPQRDRADVGRGWRKRKR
jgi:hypothetical protein